jgi:hypothetical protein
VTDIAVCPRCSTPMTKINEGGAYVLVCDNESCGNRILTGELEPLPGDIQDDSAA